MKKNYIILVVLGVCWVLLIVLIFNIAGRKKEEKTGYESERVYSVDTDTIIKRRETKAPEKIIVPSESLSVVKDTGILSIPSTLSVSETTSAVEPESAQPQEEKEVSITLPNRASLLKESIEFLRGGSRSARQVRIRAYEYKQKADTYRALAESLYKAGAREDIVYEVRSTAEFFDTLSLKIERTQGLKSRMRRLANEMETALPYIK